jgi:hypothetical protein
MGDRRGEQWVSETLSKLDLGMLVTTVKHKHHGEKSQRTQASGANV